MRVGCSANCADAAHSSPGASLTCACVQAHQALDSYFSGLVKKAESQDHYHEKAVAERAAMAVRARVPEIVCMCVCVCVCVCTRARVWIFS
jgi:hypothetical protein